MTCKLLAATCIFPAITCLAAAPSSKKQFQREEVAKFLEKRCFACHNSKLPSGEVDIKSVAAPVPVLGNRELWETVVRKLRSGEMPPKDIPRPPQAEIEGVAGWIEREYERIDRSAKPDPGRVTARRLNRYEYNNTIRDLLGVQFRPADDFPADDSGYGFDNIGDVLSLSPVLMEKYLATAEKIARLAIVAEPPQFKATRVQYKAEALAMGEHLKAAPLETGAAGPLPTRTALHAKHRFPVEAEYEIRIQLGGIRPDGSPLVSMSFWLDGEEVKVFEVDPQRGKPRNLQLRVRVTPGEHRFGAATANDGFDPAAHTLAPRDRYFAIDGFEIQGPFNPVPPPLPESHRRIMLCRHPLGSHEPECGRRIVTSLARRAYRRPVSSQEIDGLLRFVNMAQQDGQPLEQGIQVALQAVLVSPHFLFRIERDPPTNADSSHRIDEFELASRLSYFLWSSMPDEELLRAAEANTLRQPGVMQGQIRRMMKDPKAAALAENFAGQWLQLRNLDELKPDPDRFSEFDDELRKAMKRETELFFEAVASEDRSVLDFIDGNYTFLNERLAAHYGISGVEGNEFRRVELNSDQRSGILTQASILAVSSYPTRTSPVIRGKWILENFLNAPPPPPPPGVANLDEEAVGNTGSLRQQLEKHRSNATCASCHARMDPLGFGLENYDAIGAWRTRDGKFPIDTAGTLPNGKSFRTPAELKVILRADKDEFVRCLAEKLLTYALGRGLERYDRPAVQSISRSVAADGYKFSSLIANIVDSLPFQMRRGESGKS